MSFHGFRGWGRGGRRRRPDSLWAWTLGLTFLTPSCAALREVAALRQVEFSIDQVSDVRLAGVDLTSKRSYDDLGAGSAARVATAVLRKSVPLQFDLHLRAENPGDNAVSARLVRMEWTLLLQDKETIRGTIDRSIVLPPGEPRDIPITMSLDLLDFFAGSARDLVAVAAAASGHTGTRASIALRAAPSIDTPLGPMQYPEPITILRHEIGAPSRL
jgi:hypothetical protein